MQVIDANNGVLTNTEVLELLVERKQQRIQHLQQLQNSGTPSQISLERTKIDSQQHRAAIENKTLQYFQKTKLNQFKYEQLKNYLLLLKDTNFQLSENEIIQLVNLLPETDVEFYLILENCSDRFTEDQINILKDFVQQIRQTQ